MNYIASLFKSIMSTDLLIEAPPAKRAKQHDTICVWSVMRADHAEGPEEKLDFNWVTLYQSNDETKTLEEYVRLSVDYLFEYEYEVGAIPGEFKTFERQWRQLPLAEAVAQVEVLIASAKDHIFVMKTRCDLF